MTAQNPGNDRRRAERFRVGWNAVLNCLFPNHEEDIEIMVAEVSATGARLELKTLKVGSNHIVIGSESSRFTLKLSLSDHALQAPVRIVWYSTDQERDLFNLGVMFIHTSRESGETVRKLLEHVVQGKT